MKFHTSKTRFLVAAVAVLATGLWLAPGANAQCAQPPSFNSGFCYLFSGTSAAGEQLMATLEVTDPNTWESFPTPVGFDHRSGPPCGSGFHLKITTVLGGNTWDCEFLPGGPGDGMIRMNSMIPLADMQFVGDQVCTLNGGPPVPAPLLFGVQADGPGFMGNPADPGSLDFTVAATKNIIYISPAGIPVVIPRFLGEPCVKDEDGDGVLDEDDLCPGTAATDPDAGVAVDGLLPNHWADLDGDGVFDVGSPRGKANGNPISGPSPSVSFSIEDTAGCNCAQVLDELGLGLGHWKHGCSMGAMRQWLSYVATNPPVPAPDTSPTNLAGFGDRILDSETNAPHRPTVRR